MYKIAVPVFLVCETPLHAGSGDSLGVVDLPIQRERHTSFPKIEGSSLKGAIRQAFESLSNPDKENKIYKLSDKGSGDKLKKWSDELDIKWTKKVKNAADNSEPLKEAQKDRDENTLTKYQEAINLTFGPENAGNEGYAGALGFTDARLLLFPVKSMKGVFAWITCPKVLQQFKKDLNLTNNKYVHELPKELTAPEGCRIFVKDKSDRKIVLEEYTFSIDADNADGPCSSLARWLSEVVTSENFWVDKMKKDIIVLSDDDFTDFVNLSTEVITRTKIKNETGTVEPGALFTEEYLPAESVLYSLVLASPIFKEKDGEKGIFQKVNGKSEEELVMDFFKNGLPDVIQIGGNATLGKGLVRTKPL
jgi:CRISPR-associated protein Cmr4